MNNVEAGLLIRKIRKEKNLKVAELANHLNISQPSLSRIENGTRDISFSMLNNICHHLDIPMSQFMYILENSTGAVDYTVENNMTLPIKEQLIAKIEQLTEHQQKSLYMFLDSYE